MIGTVTALPVVSRVRNGKIKAVHLQVRLSDPRDVRNVQYYPQVGEDTVPLPGDKVVIYDAGGTLVSVASYDTIDSTVDPGEKEFYSRSAATTKALRMKLKKDGKLYAGNTVTNLCAIILGLIDEIKDMSTSGSPASHVVSPGSKLSFEAYKNEIRKVLTETP